MEYNDSRMVQRVKNKIDALERRIDEQFNLLDIANKVIKDNRFKVKTLRDFYQLDKFDSQYMLGIDGVMDEISKYNTIIVKKKDEVDDCERLIDTLTKQVIDLKVNLNWLRD